MTELLAMHQTNHIDDANLAYGEAQDQMALLPNYYAWIARRLILRFAVGKVRIVDVIGLVHCK